jgi:hypothetical protein
MPKKMLTGTLEEQCAFLYKLAQEKMEAGNFTGALHALKEIEKHAPDYPGSAELLAQAKSGKREQSLLIWCGFAGAIGLIFFGTLWNVPNDLWFLGLALSGAVLGYLLGRAILGISRRGRTSPADG